MSHNIKPGVATGDEVQAIFAYAKEKGFKFIFTFLYKGASSYNGFVNKLNFKDNNLNAYHVKIPVLPLYRWSYPYKNIRLFYDKYINLLQVLFFKRSGHIQNQSADINELIKDDGFYLYKSTFSNAKNIVAKGVRVYCKVKKDGALAVGDMDKTDYDSFKKSLVRLKTFCFFAGIRLIHFEQSAGSYFDLFLKKNYTPYHYYQLCTHPLDETFPVDSIQFSYGDVDTF